ncbi:MAG: MBL fold metallo-hydrolase [Gammaproteobacteria bacterium]|nr:MBL fold metallo-hydrolase [Gammaproteobacteria bacterium]
MHPDVRPFCHEPTSTWSYVVSDPESRTAAIIDPALDFDIHSGRCWTAAADEIVAHMRRERLTLEWILETHAHADHLSAAPHIKAVLGGRIAIGAGICKVQQVFRDVFNLGPGFPVDGRQFDRLLRDGEEFQAGSISIRAIATPGHTNDSLSYLIGDAVFVGDSIFMPDGGTARCDFPGGDAVVLYASIRRLYELPPDTRVFVCHDYSPGGREIRCETTIAAQRSGNIHLRDGVTEAEFVALRTKRDAGLDVPELLYPAVQANIRAGQLPDPEANGRRYLKLPLTCPVA